MFTMRTSSLARVLGVSVIGAALCLATAACSKDGDNGATPEVPHNENVKLPPVPELPLLDIPTVYPDNTLSVMGLLINRDDHMLKTVTVSGMVVDIYKCDIDEKSEAKARKKSEGENQGPRPGCLYPHFYLADTPDSPKRVLVTGYNADHYEPQLQEVTRYRITGHYSVQARGFSSSENGLIVADSLEGSGLVPPPEPEEN